jgi:ATP-dependent DNA helicase RecG
LINAFCHRDYREYESVEVAIFKDRLEIRNSGGVFGEINLEQIIKGQAPSKRRNPLIADLFKRIHFGERWGRGIKLILFKEPDAQFKDFGDFFVIIFKRKFKEEDAQKTSEKTSEKIIQLIKMNSEISAEKLSREIGISSRAIEMHLSNLKKIGKIFILFQILGFLMLEIHILLIYGLPLKNHSY